jgi:hypothetical protein
MEALCRVSGSLFDKGALPVVCCHWTWDGTGYLSQRLGAYYLYHQILAKPGKTFSGQRLLKVLGIK